MDFNICLFDVFETLDVFGPVEIFGRLPEVYDLKYFSMDGGIIESRQKTKIVTKPIAQARWYIHDPRRTGDKKFNP